MKIQKIVISTILLAGYLNISAQYADGLLKLSYNDSSGEVGFTTYIYNGLKLPCKAIWELANGTRWSVNYHEFDSNGNMVRKYREFSDSLTTLQTFSYNGQNQLIHETFSRSDGIEGSADYIYEKGICIYADCKGYNGWFTGRINYRYDHSGIKESAGLERDSLIIGTIDYSKDISGRIISEVWTFTSGFRQTYIYQYQDNNCTQYRSSNIFIRPSCSWRITEENYDYSGQGGGPSYYKYGDSGSLDHKTFVRSDGMKTETDFFYAPGGLLERSVRHYSDGKRGTFTYIYNKNNQLTERDFERSDGFKGRERYSYDSAGRLIDGEYLNFDGWLTGKLKFTHDRYDRIISAVYEGEDGLTAEIEFEYDRDSNLIKINWRFSNGATQTYWFKYEMQKSSLPQ